MEFLKFEWTRSQNVREPSPRRHLHQNNWKLLQIYRNQSNMGRLSIIIDKIHLDLSKEVGYNIEKVPEFLCEHCGVILSTKQSPKYQMVIIHSEIVTSYQCSKGLTTCNRLDNIRNHVRKHSGQTITPKTVMYEIKEMSPEHGMPKRPRPMPKKTPLPIRPYFNDPMSTSDYIYQQTLKPKQMPPNRD